jgi:uncharacterized protein
MAAGQVSHLNPNLDYIAKAAMLHDIGILHTNSPELGCRGKHPYMCGLLSEEQENGFCGIRC